VPPEAGYVLVIVNPDEVLADSDESGLAWLVGSLDRAHSAWATPIEAGEWWDRPAVPFNVVLQCGLGQSAEVATRWAAAGATIASLPTGRQSP
jgi:hypothetical protein